MWCVAAALKRFRCRWLQLASRAQYTYTRAAAKHTFHFWSCDADFEYISIGQLFIAMICKHVHVVGRGSTVLGSHDVCNIFVQCHMYAPEHTM